MSITYLSFQIGNEIFALKTHKVLEVLHYQSQTITSIPNSPEYLKGIINFRGDGIPVFDTRVQFNLTERSYNRKTFIIVVDLEFENETLRTGAIVDRVQNVLMVNPEDISEVPPMKKHFNIEFIEGVIKHDNDFLLLLNMEKVFSHEQALHLKQIEKEK